MPRLRLGVALLLPSPVAEEVDGLRRALGDGSLHRVPAHLTLVPPVNVAEAALPAALAVLRAAAAQTPGPVAVSLGPPTTFLPANPVIYLPVTAGAGAVQEMRQRVWHEPLTRTLTWPFVPHVTLADTAQPDRIAAAVAALSDYQASVTFEGVHLLVERHPGPRWYPLADVAFGPPSVVARAGPLALELVRSRLLDPEALALLQADRVDPWPVADPLVVTGRQQGAVVGTAAAWLTAGGVRREVFVVPEHRRQGIGRQMQSALDLWIAQMAWEGPA